MLFCVSQYPDLKEVIKYLISKGANVNLGAEGNAEWMNWIDVAAGATPLMISAKLGDIENIKILLNIGVDKKIKDNKGITAYEYAQSEEVKKMLQ